MVSAPLGGARARSHGRLVAADGRAVTLRLSLAWLPLVGAFALLAVAIHPLFMAGLVPRSYDTAAFFAPSWEFLARGLHAGQLPLWNPNVFGGASFAGDPQSQVFYPPTLVLFSLFSLPLATAGWFAFHYMVAAAGTFRLARNLTLSPRASVIAAVAFAASTYLVARAQAPALLAGATWVPVVLAATVGTSLSQGREAPWVNARLALAFALQILSGGQAVLLVTAAACVVVALTIRSGRVVVRTVIGLGLALMLAAPQLLPMLSLVRSSTLARGVDVRGFGALAWSDRPILAGAFARAASETAPLYAGICGVGQAGVALLTGRSRRPVQVIVALGGLGIVWSLGLVGRVVSPLVPSLATLTSHQPVRALPLAALCLALAIGIYWDTRHGAGQIVAAIALSAGAFVVAGTLGPVSRAALGVLVAGTLAAMVCAWWRPRALWPVVAFAVILTVDLAVHNVNLRNTHQPPAVWEPAARLYPSPPLTADVLRDASVGIDGSRYAWLARPAVRKHQLSRARTRTGRSLLLNGGSTRYGLPALGGYNPVIPRAWARLVAASNGRRIADRHFVYVTRAPTKLLRAYDVRMYVCEIGTCPAALDPIWRGRGVEVVRDNRAHAFAAISHRAHGGVRLTSLSFAWSTPDTIDVSHTLSASRGGTAVVAERYAPGWQATVDGRAATIAPNRFGEMTVIVRTGWRRVLLSYNPPDLQLGITLALIALAACLWQHPTRLARSLSLRLRPGS
ncbi:MAG: hypothetical protein ABI317_04175 [Gaiellales bacterium]